MRTHDEISAVVFSLEKQYKNFMDEKSSMKLARYFGYTVGLLGNAVVPPYTYQFGQRISHFLFDDDNSAGKILVSLYFSVVATVTLGSLGINVCGEIFPESLQVVYDNPFKQIKVRHLKEKISVALGLSAAILCSIVSNIPGTYLTDQAYREFSPFIAVILDIVNQIAWSTVSAWALYAVPEQIYKEFMRDFSLESKNLRSDLFNKIDKLTKAVALATEHELYNMQMEFFPEDKFTSSSLINIIQYQTNLPPGLTTKSRLRKSIAVTGMMIGAVSIFFYYPVGKSSGHMLANLLGMEDYGIYFEILMAITNYCSQATLAILSTKQVFELIYDRLGNLCVKNNIKSNQIILQEPLLSQREIQQQTALFWPKVKAFLYDLAIAAFAVTASSYKAEMTAEYVPGSAGGIFLTAISAIGASCLGGWSLDRLANKFTNRTHVSLQSKLLRRIGLLRLTVDHMDERHLEALSSTTGLNSTFIA